MSENSTKLNMNQDYFSCKWQKPSSNHFKKKREMYWFTSLEDRAPVKVVSGYLNNTSLFFLFNCQKFFSLIWIIQISYTFMVAHRVTSSSKYAFSTSCALYKREMVFPHSLTHSYWLYSSAWFIYSLERYLLTTKFQLSKSENLNLQKF